MLLAMSILPYKTPWLVLGALLPLILTAGWGVADLLGRLTPGMKLPAYVLLAIAGGHLIWQSYRANFAAFDDPTTPMVYAHPNDDVRRIGEILEDIGRAGVGAVPVQVVVSGDDYWPLPWYLRRLPQVGWWGGIGPEFTPTPVILVSADREADLLARLYDAPPPGERPLYVPLFERPMYLRPGCEVKGYITLELSSRITRPRG
jgi:predicted membrane-bound mannosyltransferase